MLSIMADLGYDAVGLGQNDYLVGSDKYYDTAAKYKINVLDANPNAHKSTLPYMIKNVCGVKVGIISFGYAPPSQDMNEYEMRKMIYATYKKVRDASDVLILLDQAGRANTDWLKRNAARLGAPDVVIGKSGQSAVVDKTQIAASAPEGKRVGVVNIEIASNGEKKITIKSVELASTIPYEQATEKRIAEFMNKGKVPVQTTPAAAATNPSAPISATEQQTVKTSQKTYLAPMTCKACHANEYENWAASKHAKAIRTLTEANRAVAECLPCHSEEYLRTQKVTVTQDKIGGVDCMTCHSESVPHGMERTGVANRPKVSSVKCLTCHNKERSPAYNEQVYFPKITHK